jgi:sugar phosphate isomerase/epimerase
MPLTRRDLLAGAAAAPWMLDAARVFAQAAAAGGPRLGVCDWSSGAKGVAALDAAKAMGLQGVQISPRAAEAKLSYNDPAEQEAYRAKAKETGVAVASLGLTISNGCPLATDDRAVSWLEQTIDATQALGCKAILLAFFANGDLTKGKELKTKEIDAVVDRLKAVAPRAKEKGVVLGIESYLSAKDLLGILDRIGSEAVGVYYDIANTISRGYDCAEEIRMLKGRINEFHFKDDKGELGTGSPVAKAAEAMKEIGYAEWIIFERHHGKDPQGYFRRSAEITRALFGLQAGA